MIMKTAHSNRKNGGFTLIEILTVMSIIAILAGMIFAGTKSGIEAARKTQARSLAMNLRTAAMAYFDEYRRMPVPKGKSGSDHIDFATDDSFMDILLGADTQSGIDGNPRGIVFFDGRPAKPATGQTYRNGVNLNNNGGGSLWDPWAHLFGVRMDVSNRNRMANPEIDRPSIGGGEGAPDWGDDSDTNSNTPNYISESIAVWSAGKNQKATKDNITTWD